jgi:dodecin
MEWAALDHRGFVGQFADTRHHYKKPSSNRSMSVAKIVEIVGSSDKGWEDAAQVAVEEAMRTLRGIRGIEVADQTAQVDPKTGKILKYRTCIKLSFGLESK